MNVMKKQYIKPTFEVVLLKSAPLMAGSDRRLDVKTQTIDNFDLLESREAEPQSSSVWDD